MDIVIFDKKRETKKEHINTLLWYDPDAKKMISFNGSRLQFKYAFDQKYKKYRSIPTVVVDSIKTSVVDSVELDNFLNRMKDRFSFSSARSGGIVSVSIAEEDVDVFTDILERERFLYDIE